MPTRSDGPPLPNCDHCRAPVREYVERECTGCGRLGLYDVLDVDGFVADAIRDGKAQLNEFQREEMKQEGRRIMLHLARSYQPGKGGRDAAGSRFSGFAAKYLRLKLSDAYNRIVQDATVVKIKQDDGTERRELRYQPPSVSWDDVDLPDETGGDGYDETLASAEAEIDRSAMLEKRLVRLYVEGVNEREAAQLLDLEIAEVKGLSAILRVRLGGERSRLAA